MNVTDQYGFVRFTAGIYTDAITAELDIWQKENRIKRLWAGDATLWTNSDESQWTGWLNVDAAKIDLPRIETLANDIKATGATDIVLLGMGGSSLCPAMIAKTFGKIVGFPRLQILDSTDPIQIRHLEESIDLGKTFFIVSSKSGNTLEPKIFKDYFYARLQVVLNKTEVGDRFIAISDPGTTLDSIAKKEEFRAIFYGKSSIGGRYSALSNFGIVPSGLMGLDIKNFLGHVEKMHQACSPRVLVKDNPGAVLGIILGVCAKQGKDKITLVISPEINALGAWLEQLLAESTGKNGKGLIPVDQEPLGSPAVYSDDRLFIYIRLESAPDPDQDRNMLMLEQAGLVVVRLTLKDKMHLGAELFRWEIATDVVGSILGIDPFDQPDVEESKILTLRLTEQYEKTGEFSQLKPFFFDNGITLFCDEQDRTNFISNFKNEPSIANYLQAYLSQVKKDDYVNLSAFIEMSDEYYALLQEIRVLIRDAKRVATCVGFGPRFLHSTGQVYKGGPNTGVFLQITSDFSEDIQVPGHRYTFGLVIAAQAQADYIVLAKRFRRVLRIHLDKDVQGGLRTLRESIRHALWTEYKNGQQDVDQ